MYIPVSPYNEVLEQTLHEIAIKLQVNDAQVITRACDELWEMLVDDFPPDLLLHTPDILEVRRNIVD